MPASPCPVPRSAISVLILGLVWTPAHAQIPGALKKKAEKAAGAAVPVPLQPPKYTNELLELTEPRLEQLIAGKKAAQEAYDAPDGPKAVRKQLDGVTLRRDEIQEKQGRLINTWDEKRTEFERCVGDKLYERSEQIILEVGAKMGSDRAFQLKLSELSVALQEAQQKGDKATAERIVAELDALRKPSRADSLAALKACDNGMAGVPPVVAEYNSLLKQREELANQLSQAERRVQRAEDEASQMTTRQRAIACERVQAWQSAKAAGKPAVEFSADEIAALEKLEKPLKGKCD